MGLSSRRPGAARTHRRESTNSDEGKTTFGVLERNWRRVASTHTLQASGRLTVLLAANLASAVRICLCLILARLGCCNVTSGPHGSRRAHQSATSRGCEAANPWVGGPLACWPEQPQPPLCLWFLPVLRAASVLGLRPVALSATMQYFVDRCWHGCSGFGHIRHCGELRRGTPKLPGRCRCK